MSSDPVHLLPSRRQINRLSSWIESERTTQQQLVEGVVQVVVAAIAPRGGPKLRTMSVEATQRLLGVCEESSSTHETKHWLVPSELSGSSFVAAWFPNDRFIALRSAVELHEALIRFAADHEVDVRIVIGTCGKDAAEMLDLTTPNQITCNSELFPSVDIHTVVDSARHTEIVRSVIQRAKECKTSYKLPSTPKVRKKSREKIAR